MMGVAGFTTTLMVLVVILTSTCIYGKESYDEVILTSTSIYGKESYDENKVQRLLKRLNKPALKSIKSEDGDIIDCIPITSQPAFDHPLLKNHTVQMRPTFIPKADSKFTKKEANNITQLWRKNGECPENTVAIRRITKEDILRAKSIESFGKKSHKSSPLNLTADSVHEYAYMGMNGQFFGTKFEINTWRPAVEIRDEFSLAQTWLATGSGTSTNTIEAGWQVYPGMYGDNNLRIFVYWTRDGYQKTGCYNTACPGFVQRSNRITVGGTYSQISQYNGAQYDFPLLIWKDSGNWWLMIGDELVGYWPGSLFDSINNGATTLQWGGEIINARTSGGSRLRFQSVQKCSIGDSNPLLQESRGATAPSTPLLDPPLARTGGRHTETDMGSGHFANEWYKKASYFRKLLSVDGSNTLREPEGLYSAATNGNCYSVQAGQSGSSEWGAHFFYGGPGRNNNCP